MPMHQHVDLSLTTSSCQATGHAGRLVSSLKMSCTFFVHGIAVLGHVQNAAASIWRPVVACWPVRAGSGRS